MNQAAKGLFLRHLDINVIEVPRRFLVAVGDAQEQIARSRHAPRDRQMRQRTERIPEPAARPLGHETQRRERQVLRLVKTVEHSRPCSCCNTLVITELRLRRIDADSRKLLDAYAAGVNAFLHSKPVLPAEFWLLRVQPEAWSALDSVAWAKMLAWDLGGNWRSELLRLQLASRLSTSAIQE